MNCDIVKIDWIDATTVHDVSYQIEDVKKFELVKGTTIGYLVHKDTKKIIICSMVFEEVGLKTIHIIPKSCVSKTTVLLKKQLLPSGDLRVGDK